ncbi:iron chaperone [Protaetiibacter larvae]|uniref:DUF1801 domain-containing protein n=1 Tax=Protaetiibacter larvae TaxID=2592654 RepID=A0A5C1Y9D4_9MICO|nr:DUF1801 domain-containing protein [Protaetiibacter larvae]QEO10491.1 DUF1801 domain-containing protein [Protaetiibacter larvae]
MAEKTQRGGDTWTEDELAAMKEHAAEQKAARSRKGTKEEKAAAEAQGVLDKIAELSGDDKVLAEQVHAIVTAAAPELAPKTWYGMPAYYKDGKVLCFFQPGSKFKARYSTLGFDESAQLDDGRLWPTSFALTTIGPEEEATITTLVTRALGR